MRGEYDILSEDEKRAIGSPPRAWGILSVLRGFVRKTRFTPTCVGNTSQSLALHLIYAVHPHVRGEYAPGR